METEDTTTSSDITFRKRVVRLRAGICAIPTIKKIQHSNVSFINWFLFVNILFSIMISVFIFICNIIYLFCFAYKHYVHFKI